MTASNAPRPHRTRLLALAAAALIVAGLAACGDDDDDADVASDDTSATTDTTAGDTATGGDYGGGTDGDASGDDAVVAKDFTFTALTASGGSEVTFKNEDSAPHTMTADDGAFDSGRVEGGESGTVTAPTEPGDYAFHCEIHPDMKSTLTVEA